jgi:hypothetical protein
VVAGAAEADGAVLSDLSQPVRTKSAATKEVSIRLGFMQIIVIY